jgi:hypothetical protein
MKNTQEMTQTETTLRSITVKDWAAEFNLKQIGNGGVVNYNTNGYPYITFVDANNEAENIYFSKRGAQMVAEGQVIEKGFFDDFQMCLAMSPTNGLLWKISPKGESTRIELADVL